MTVEVLRGGWLTTLQDGGRRGHAAAGIGRAGAMDEVALRLSNALVGNAPDAPALEATLQGPLLRIEVATTIALAGAAFDLRIDGVPAPAWRPLPVAAGALVDLGRARRGCRGYLALAGGFAADPVLGSVAMDLNAGLGPFGGRPLATGDVLSSGTPRTALAGIPSWSLDPRPWFDPDPHRVLRLLPGSHEAAFTAGARAALFDSAFRIDPASNRVGLRLQGSTLALAAPLEIASTPVAPGTVQVPPDGQPIVLMAEHPVTGGYPRIAQVAAIDLPFLAQRRPGDAVRFAPIGIEEAQTRYLAREEALQRLALDLHQRLREP